MPAISNAAENMDCRSERARSKFPIAIMGTIIIREML
jgi:hypothetical protein